LAFGDTAYGESGNDVFVLDALTVRRIDGGTGTDVIRLPDDTNNPVFDLRASTGWKGHTFERIEVLSMEDGLDQTLKLDRQGLQAVIDGENNLLNDELGLVVDGNIGDVIELTGDFEFVEDRTLSLPDLTQSQSLSTTSTTKAGLYTGLSEGNISLYFDQDVEVLVTHDNGGSSRYGNSSNNTITGTNQGGETLSGREGNDVLDGGAGSDRLLGGDGDDTLTFDGADAALDGGKGVDTLNLSGNIDLSGLDQISNIEQLDMSGNNTVDVLTVGFADLFDLVGDNSLSGLSTDSEEQGKVVVINGDAEDTLILSGEDVRNQTPTKTDIDLYGDGKTYALFQDTSLGIDVYVLSSLLGSESDSSSAESSSSTTGLSTLDSYLHGHSFDVFGGI
jgi:hypothetical protein